MVRAAFKAIPVIEHLPLQITSICAFGSRIILGSSTGTLLIYNVKDDGNSNITLTLEDTKKDFSKKSIDRVEVIKETGLLACLSEDFVSLYDLNTFTKSITLNNTKGATIMTAITSIELISGIPTIISKLAVVVKKKIIIFEWRDSEYFESKEYSSSDRIESIRFGTVNFIFVATFKDFWSLQLPMGQWDELFSADTSSLITVGAGFDATISNTKDSDVISGNASTARQSSTPQPSAGNWGNWSLGLGGVLTAGYSLSSRVKPLIERMPNDELLLCRENTAVFVTSFGKISKRRNEAGYRALVRFSHNPIDLTFTSTYVITISGQSIKRSLIKKDSINRIDFDAINESSSLKNDTAYCIEIRNILTHSLVQQIELTCSVPESDILYLSQDENVATQMISTDAPKLLAKQIDGKQVWVAGNNTLWGLFPYPISLQVEEQIHFKNYEEAESLVMQSDMILESERQDLLLKVKWLHSIYLISIPKKCEIGFNMLLDINAVPTEAISTFPKFISGELYVPDDSNDGNSAFGYFSSFFSLASNKSSKISSKDTSSEPISSESSNSSTSSPSITSNKSFKENASTSNNSRKANTHTYHNSKESINELLQGLMRYLIEHRRLIQATIDKKADLEYLSKTCLVNSSESRSVIDDESTNSTSILDFSLHTESFSVLDIAKYVDTTLLKVYLKIAPSLVGSLVRLVNYCDIQETEKILLKNSRYKDLIDFYYCKGLHRKALDLLFKRGSDPDEFLLKGVMQTIYYLQKLPSSYLDLILEYFSWPLKLSVDFENGISNSLLDGNTSYMPKNN
ncbi:Vacuolar morphogenesis protein 6 [Smittium culicis]|uniref:Vacuolar morphogenesis protein 6 n=1 Tax=Smittium culicis TaxID=133412 RepID=A0A1R1XUV6_9FUNG|nr:Vacuolar morphogenesis protein 6 [Smittium culicis]